MHNSTKVVPLQSQKCWKSIKNDIKMYWKSHKNRCQTCWKGLQVSDFLQFFFVLFSRIAVIVLRFEKTSRKLPRRNRASAKKTIASINVKNT